MMYQSMLYNALACHMISWCIVQCLINLLSFEVGLGITSGIQNLNRTRTKKSDPLSDPKCKKYLNGSCRVVQKISEPEVLLTESERVTRKI